MLLFLMERQQPGDYVQPQGGKEGGSDGPPREHHRSLKSLTIRGEAPHRGDQLWWGCLHQANILEEQIARAQEEVPEIVQKNKATPPPPGALVPLLSNLELSPQLQWAQNMQLLTPTQWQRAEVAIKCYHNVEAQIHGIQQYEKIFKSSDQKENDKYPEINPEDTEIYNLNDTEFKIAIT